ncbi:MAG: spore cortex-lytic enzyme [Oscillospiraceae bacterium]|nr:spore cortex-lytic enzyme [Oscillospiraceae bacterium]
MQDRKKLALSLAALFAANILLILVMKAVPDARAATFRQGSQGETVRQIQTKLQNWGYYSGAIDGDYGPKTADAVKHFQRRNNLTVDGAANTRTLQALGIYLPAPNPNTEQRGNDVELLARLISAEAKGEPYSAQVAVGAVVLNRTRHPSFPNSIPGVIYQPGAFSSLSGAALNKPAPDSAVRAARDAINGVDPSFGAVYFYDPRSVPNQWIASRPAVLDIGNRRFTK